MSRALIALVAAMAAALLFTTWRISVLHGRLQAVNVELATQTDAIERTLAEAKRRQKAAEEASKAARRRLDATLSERARLAEELASRQHKDESCEAAAESVRQRWLSR